MKKAKDWVRQLCSVIPREQKRPVQNFQRDHFQLFGLQLDRSEVATLNYWGCGSQDDRLVMTGQ